MHAGGFLFAKNALKNPRLFEFIRNSFYVMFLSFQDIFILYFQEFHITFDVSFVLFLTFTFFGYASASVRVWN